MVLTHVNPLTYARRPAVAGGAGARGERLAPASLARLDRADHARAPRWSRSSASLRWRSRCGCSGRLALDASLLRVCLRQPPGSQRPKRGSGWFEVSQQLLSKSR
jgi:hypothetical protein